MFVNDKIGSNLSMRSQFLITLRIYARARENVCAWCVHVCSVTYKTNFARCSFFLYENAETNLKAEI